MEPPNHLTREFEVDIRPTSVFLRCLEEMQKLADKAILIVTHFDTIRIFTPVRSRRSCAVLDIDSDHVFAPSNADGYSLCFDLYTWIRALRAPIFREPGAPLSIRKSAGSVDIFGLFGVDRQEIRLGEAEFAQIYTLNLNLPRLLEVSMTSNQFTEFVRAFEIRHADRVSAVEMQTTASLIRCVTPISQSYHRAEEFVINSIGPDLPEGFFRFRLRWNRPLFKMFCSAATASDSVELVVMRNSRHEKLYMFRFLRHYARDDFFYVEKEPPPDIHLHNAV